MCGIAGYHRLDGAPELRRAGLLADELMIAIESRGRDAAGLLALDGLGRPLLEKRAVPARRFVHGRRLFPQDTRTMLLHTRWATTGRRHSSKDAHPVFSGDVYAVHNGTISNADELFDAFGLPRLAQVDSEIIPALVSYAGWNQVEHALSLMRGGAATAIVNAAVPGELVLAKLRWFPLVYAHLEKQGLLMFASTEYALRTAWWKTHGESLPADPVELAQGTGLRVNGSIERFTIPGAYDEPERAWEPTRKSKPAAKSKRTRSSGRRQAKSKSKAAVAVGHSTPIVGDVLFDPQDGSLWMVDETPTSRHGLRKTFRLEPYGAYGRARALKRDKLKAWRYHSRAPMPTRRPERLSLPAGPAERGVRQSHALSSTHTADELREYLDALDEARARDLGWGEEDLLVSYAPGKYWD